MTSWNHRVLRFAQPDGEPWLAIHEVFYDDAGAPWAYSEAAVSVEGETVEELGEALDRMRTALDKPVLEPSDFPAGKGPPR